VGISGDVRRCLDQADVRGMWDLWSQVMPGLPQPHTFVEAEASLHYARTAARSIVFWKRAYSHAWLREREMPSGLPDGLRPGAERLYPRVVEGVGVAVRAPPARRELGEAVALAMRGVVEECYAVGATRPEFVRARMSEARAKVLKGD
jgi:hypothetical protein